MQLNLRVSEWVGAYSSPVLGEVSEGRRGFCCGAVLYDAVRVAITQYSQSRKEQNQIQAQNIRLEVPPPKLLT